MTVPFFCLFLACLIPLVLAPVAAYHKNKQFGSVDNKNPRAQTAALEGAGARAAAAQLNAWEALAVFTPAVIVNHLGGADPGSSATLAVVWVVARVSHGFFYVADIDKARSAAFLVAFGCVVALFFI